MKQRRGNQRKQRCAEIESPTQLLGFTPCCSDHFDCDGAHQTTIEHSLTHAHTFKIVVACCNPLDACSRPLSHRHLFAPSPSSSSTTITCSAVLEGVHRFHLLLFFRILSFNATMMSSPFDPIDCAILSPSKSLLICRPFISFHRLSIWFVLFFVWFHPFF